MLLPVWNHPTEVVQGAPVPQATACANSGQIAVTYVSLVSEQKFSDNNFPKILVNRMKVQVMLLPKY
jgi:hypothetical protein